MPAVGGMRIKLLFTAPNFLKHFVDFGEKTLRNDIAIRQSVRGPVLLDHGVVSSEVHSTTIIFTEWM